MSFNALRARLLGNPSTLIFTTDQGRYLPSDFPVEIWNAQQQHYSYYWNLYSGEIWNERDPKRVDSNGQAVLRFPLQINYAKTICNIHNAVLWGEVRDNALPLAAHRVVPKRKPGDSEVTDEMRRSAERMEKLLNEIWIENNGRSLQYEGGLVQQFLGGIVYRVAWEPFDPRLKYQIKLEMVLPDFFLPIWNSTNPNDLLECFVVYRIPAREALLRYGYQSKDRLGPIYVEHWTKERVSIYLNGEPVRVKVNGQTITYRDYPNIFGVIPFVYIPRERAGDYYGLSVLFGLEGLMRELNARAADLGDLLSDYSKVEIFVRNLTSSPKTMDIGTLRPAINLGQSMPGSNHEPDAFRLDPPNMPGGLFNFPAFLFNQLMRDASIPPVALGEDEGSQRSALTLAFRMMPLLNRVRGVRTYWTTGLNHIAYLIHRILSVKGIENVTESDWYENDYSVQWAPMIARDTELDLNFAVLSYQSHFMSPQTAMDYLGFTEDPEREYQRVMEHHERLAKLKLAAEPPDTRETPVTASTVSQNNK